GMQMYAADNDDRWPFANWEDVVRPYVKSANNFTCPAVAGKGGAGGYAFNQQMQATRESSVTPANTPAVFESDAPGPSASVEFSRICNPPRQLNGNSVAY